MSDPTENEEPSQGVPESATGAPEADVEPAADGQGGEAVEVAPTPVAAATLVDASPSATSPDSSVDHAGDGVVEVPSIGSVSGEDTTEELSAASGDAGPEEHAAPEPRSDTVEATEPAERNDEIAATLASLDVRLEESQRLMGRQVDLVDRLHAENQRLRAGELRAATLPLIRDLLRLHDDIGRLAQEDTGDGSRDLNVVKVSLLDALARNGVIASSPQSGESFDPKLHSASGILPADEEAADRTIAEVVRVGFHWEDGQVVRAADVRVFKYQAPAEASDHPPEGSQTTNGDS
jgi:molecular chaperone GrpE (heat shock protein)